MNSPLHAARPTRVQHGPICAPAPPPAVAEQAASTTLYCPMPTGRASSPTISTPAAQQEEPKRQEVPAAGAHAASPSAPKARSPQGAATRTAGGSWLQLPVCVCCACVPAPFPPPPSLLLPPRGHPRRHAYYSLRHVASVACGRSGNRHATELCGRAHKQGAPS